MTREEGTQGERGHASCTTHMALILLANADTVHPFNTSAMGSANAAESGMVEWRNWRPCGDGWDGGHSGEGFRTCWLILSSPTRAHITQAERMAACRASVETGESCLVMREVRGVERTFPQCRKCGAGDLVPLSDFGSQGASIEYKAWVCTNPNCLYNVKIRNGDIIINEPVSDGSMHAYRGAR